MTGRHLENCSVDEQREIKFYLWWAYPVVGFTFTERAKHVAGQLLVYVPDLHRH